MDPDGVDSVHYGETSSIDMMDNVQGGPSSVASTYVSGIEKRNWNPKSCKCMN